MTDEKEEYSDEFHQRTNTQSSLKDSSEALCRLLGIKHSSSHPDTFKKHSTLFEYLADVHDLNKGYYLTTKISPSQFIEAYNSPSIKKRANAWFSLGYNLGSILSTADIMKFSTLFNNLLSESDLDGQERVSAKKLLTTAPSWTLKRASRSFSTCDPFFQSITGNKNYSRLLPAADMSYSPSFYETVRPSLIILKMACDKIVSQHSSLPSDEEFVSVLNSIDAKLKVREVHNLFSYFP